MILFATGPCLPQVFRIDVLVNIYYASAPALNCFHSHTYIYVIYISVCVCMHIHDGNIKHVHICIHMCVHMCMTIFFITFANAHVHKSEYVCVCVFKYARMYVCICMFTVRD